RRVVTLGLVVLHDIEPALIGRDPDLADLPVIELVLLFEHLHGIDRGKSVPATTVVFERNSRNVVVGPEGARGFRPVRLDAHGRAEPHFAFDDIVHARDALAGATHPDNTHPAASR